MKKSLAKTTLREITQTFGRYFAILAIVALGVGFFAGLKICRPAMVETGNDYYNKTSFFDFKFMSDLGFTQSQVELIENMDFSKETEGSVSYDALMKDDENQEYAIKVLSVTEKINKAQLLSGRMPETETECVVDSLGLETVQVGDVITLSENNDEETTERFRTKSFTVTGIVDSPLYIGFERGTTSLGNGKLDGFIYLLPNAFTEEIYTEIFITIPMSEMLFSSDYEQQLDLYEEKFIAIENVLSESRYEEIYDEYQAEIDTAMQELEDSEKEGEETFSNQKEELENYWQQLLYMDSLGNSDEVQQGKIALQSALKEYQSAYEDFLAQVEDAREEIEEEQEKLEELEEPQIYLLGRETNTGYVSFENDSAIVEGIANVFPAFFFLVAALVCITTMTRMVEEQRMQIGILKALGYKNGSIVFKYLWYSGSAAAIGVFGGYFIGTWLFPSAIWDAYSMMYRLPDIHFVFSWKLLLLSALVAAICSTGATYLACRVELSEKPAQLIRPRPPKNGKRIFLERIGFIWKRLPFLYKVTFRNVFRYKGKFYMMILGISGCTALLVAGFGIKDSIAGVADMQFEEIQKYDISVMFSEYPDLDQSETEALEKMAHIDQELYVSLIAMDLTTMEEQKSIQIVIPKEENNFSDFIDLHDEKGEPIAFPQEGEIVLTQKICSQLGLKTGDSITLVDEEMNSLDLTISGICVNYFYHYGYISVRSYQDQLGQEPEYKSLYIKLIDLEELYKDAAYLMNQDKVVSVSVNMEMREQFKNMMESLNSIILLVIFSAGTLALIVLYNLTNINITERIREIATIKVLGFYPKETMAYVFRENILLSFLGSIAGLGFGFLLHFYVMEQIDVDVVSFDTHINAISYLYSFLLTFFFTALVHFIMYFKLEHIHMAESLKSVE